MTQRLNHVKVSAVLYTLYEEVSVEPERRYNRLAPPSTVEEALDRIEELKGRVTVIEAKLAHSTPGIFQNDESYAAWHRRATSAMGHSQHEIVFLNRWLHNPNPEQALENEFLQQARQADQMKALARLADSLALELNQGYARQFTWRQQPTSWAEAENRLTELGMIKQQLAEAFIRLNDANKESELSNAQMAKVRAPLTRFAAVVEREIEITRSSSRRHRMQLVQTMWPIVCALALERAVAQGFALSEVELTALNGLRSIRHRKPITLPSPADTVPLESPPVGSETKLV